MHFDLGIRNCFGTVCSAFARRPYRHEPLKLPFSNSLYEYELWNSQDVSSVGGFFCVVTTTSICQFEFELMSFQGQKDVWARRSDTDLKLANNMETYVNAYGQRKIGTAPDGRFIFVFVVNYIIFSYSTPVWIIVTKPICRQENQGVCTLKTW